MDTEKKLEIANKIIAEQKKTIMSFMGMIGRVHQSDTRVKNLAYSIESVESAITNFRESLNDLSNNNDLKASLDRIEELKNTEMKLAKMEQDINQPGDRL